MGTPPQPPPDPPDPDPKKGTPPPPPPDQGLTVNMVVVHPRDQRYDTVGDWVFNGPKLDIKVSDVGNWKYHCLIQFHELIEAVLCKSRGITTEEVDQFDMNFQGSGEPGDDRAAPYFWEHQFAERMERFLADELGVDWQRYIKEIEGVYGQ